MLNKSEDEQPGTAGNQSNRTENENCIGQEIHTSKTVTVFYLLSRGLQVLFAERRKSNQRARLLKYELEEPGIDDMQKCFREACIIVSTSFFH